MITRSLPIRPAPHRSPRSLAVRVAATALWLALLVAGPAAAQSLTGGFEGADFFHRGSGSFELVVDDGQRYLEFSEDFSSTRGPDLFVWLLDGESTEGHVDLGRLQSAGGAQRYLVPDDVDLAAFDRVVIWCRAFRVLFSTALFEGGE